MYEKLSFKVIAMIVLTAFTVVGCASPVNDDGDGNSAGIPTVPIGKGTPRFVYLDADYEPAETDSGRTLLYIEDNEAAEGVAVITEVPDNDLDNGTVVRVVNNNQSVVSFFFRKNQPFPHQMAAQSEEGTVIGNFSLYNATDQQYSVLFEKEGETEKCELKNLNLNRGIFQVYEDDVDLDESQNLRLKNAVTVLAVWDSIALQIPEDDFTVNGRYVASWWNPVSWVKATVKAVFQVLPVIAVAAAIIVCAPIAIAVVETVLAIEAVRIAIVAVAAAAVIVSAVVAGYGRMLPGRPPSDSYVHSYERYCYAPY